MAKNNVSVKVELPAGLVGKEFPADVLEKTNSMIEAAQARTSGKIDLTKVVALPDNQELVETVHAAPKKSDMMRSMYQEGMSVAQIAKATNSHYSFVYGVIKNFLGGAKPTSEKGESKSDQIRLLAAQGKTPGDIAKELNSNYSFVHTVVKKWKADQAAAMEQAGVTND